VLCAHTHCASWVSGFPSNRSICASIRSAQQRHAMRGPTGPARGQFDLEKKISSRPGRGHGKPLCFCLPPCGPPFVSTTLGLVVPSLSSLPRHHNNPLAKCGCKKHCMDFHGDHTSTCTAHSGATKAHDWLASGRVGAIVPHGRTQSARSTA
jgi:hypothetical protein